jgi:phospholipid-translocating ATPase
MLNGKREEYQILKVIEFSSDRKMMSVIVKSKDNGKILAFTKGADDKILPIAIQSPKSI